jgi:hypothetical protein
MRLRTLSIAVIRREIARREKGGDKLRKQHSKLAAQLAALEAEMTDLGIDGFSRRGRKPGRPAGRGPGRPKGGRKAKGGMTLMQALEKGVRMGSTVSPAEAAQAAKRAGYKTVSKTFGIQVAGALAKAASFKRVGRGQYERTGSGGGAAPKARGPKRGGAKSGRKPGRPKGSKNRSKAVAPAKPVSAAT